MIACKQWDDTQFLHRIEILKALALAHTLKERVERDLPDNWSIMTWSYMVPVRAVGHAGADHKHTVLQTNGRREACI